MKLEDIKFEDIMLSKRNQFQNNKIYIIKKTPSEVTANIIIHLS